ncbi:MAG: hypothetical protein NVS3B12_34480 [Acidimicrobiales bacterium]
MPEADHVIGDAQFVHGFILAANFPRLSARPEGNLHPGPLRRSEAHMYIGIGTIVLILVIVLIVMMLRGRRV